MKFTLDTEKMVESIEHIPSNISPADYLIGCLRAATAGRATKPWLTPARAIRKPLAGSPELYDTFYKAYPRKVGRKIAFKAWQKAICEFKSEQELLEACLDALEWQKDSEQWTKEEGAYIPHPSTWLNQGRWEDEDPMKGKKMVKYTNENGEEKWRREC